MRLIFKASANRRYKNLLTSDKVAVIIPDVIPDEYGNASFRNIVLIDRYTPNKQPRYSCINPTYTAYMPLHYVLLFPRGNTS
jgi:hypothetical protein